MVGAPVGPIAYGHVWWVNDERETSPERMHGRGLFVWPDGSQYEGQWKKNVRHGEGTYLSASGTIYRGRFWKNMRHGPGVLTYLNGNSYEGVWELDNIKGMGRYTLLAGSEMDEAEKVHLKVFGY